VKLKGVLEAGEQTDYAGIGVAEEGGVVGLEVG